MNFLLAFFAELQLIGRTLFGLCSRILVIARTDVLLVAVCVRSCCWLPPSRPRRPDLACSDIAVVRMTHDAVADTVIVSS